MKQYAKLFELDNVELEFGDGRPRGDRRPGRLRGTGARGLRAIMEEVLLSVMYEVPSREDVARVVITRETVLDHVYPTLVPREAPKREPREKSRLTLCAAAGFDPVWHRSLRSGPIPRLRIARSRSRVAACVGPKPVVALRAPRRW